MQQVFRSLKPAQNHVILAYTRRLSNFVALNTARIVTLSVPEHCTHHGLSVQTGFYMSSAVFGSQLVSLQMPWSY